MTVPDGRGSEPQRYLYRLIKNIYPNLSVIYEQEIPDLRQRFDILVKELGIAVEYDGEQHEHYIEHFHGNMNGFIEGKHRDGLKNRWAEENGIKVVRLSGDVSGFDEAQLKSHIDAIEYPDVPYDMNCISKNTRPDLEFARQFRKERYRKNKNK